MSWLRSEQGRSESRLIAHIFWLHDGAGKDTNRVNCPFVLCLSNQLKVLSSVGGLRLRTVMHMQIIIKDAAHNLRSPHPLERASTQLAVAGLLWRGLMLVLSCGSGGGTIQQCQNPSPNIMRWCLLMYHGELRTRAFRLVVHAISANISMSI